MRRSSRGDSRSVIDLVDQFLAADKQLAGYPDWTIGHRDGEQRLAWPVLIDGQGTDKRLNMTAYPDDPVLRFTITLNWPPCIWRLDFDPPHKRHYNPPDRVPRLGGYMIAGPSYHSWDDNRHLASLVALPETLECARLLPGNVRNFDNAFRWFCGETKITLGADQMPNLPPRTRLSLG